MDRMLVVVLLLVFVFFGGGLIYVTSEVQLYFRRSLN